MNSSKYSLVVFASLLLTTSAAFAEPQDAPLAPPTADLNAAATLSIDSDTPPQSQVPVHVDPIVDSKTAVAPSPAPKGFWNRFIQAYADDWHPTPGPDAATPHRGYPAPISNPPYPFTVWPIGGTVLIGYPNATAYPLTTALQNGPHGDWWKKANIQIYGWLDVGIEPNVVAAELEHVILSRRERKWN